MKRVVLSLCFLLITLALFTGCGIDEYAYLLPIRGDEISLTANTGAVVPIPNNDPTIFTNLIILYRIYMSNTDDQSPAPENFRYINSALDSHYRSINVYNYTSDRVFSASNLDSLFINNGYKYLYLENISTHKILQMDDLNPSDVLNEKLIFNFPTNLSAGGPYPAMSITSGGNYNLLREQQSGLNDISDRYFINNGELLKNNPADVNPNTAENANIAYVAMFIIAMGLNDVEYTPIYSNPTLIHVFRLPSTL